MNKLPGIEVLCVVVLLFLFINIILKATPAAAQIPAATLSWTAPGDDGGSGTATSYQMRYTTMRPDTTSQATIDNWWFVATPVTTLPVPQLSGTTQFVNVAPMGGFMARQTYYFVMKACDEVTNCSVYSNVAVFVVPGDLLAPRRTNDLRKR